MALLENIRPYPRRASSPASVTPYLPPHSEIEILLCLPDARIVEFKPLVLDSKSPKKNEYTQREIEPGTLNWTSRFERTVAVGSLRIYRAPGSIAFLNCQNAIRPILPKSQAWCVDGESKFVLGSPPLFWRIEIPKTNQDEELKVIELKRVLSKILRYEKTPCPFRRTVKVELTSAPTIVIKKVSQKSTNQSKEYNDPNDNSFEGFKNYNFDTRFSKADRRNLVLSPRFLVKQNSLEFSENFLGLDLDSNYHSQNSNSTQLSTGKRVGSHQSIEQTYGSNLQKSHFDHVPEMLSDYSKEKSNKVFSLKHYTLGRGYAERNFQPPREQKCEKKRSHSASYDVRQPYTSHITDSSAINVWNYELSSANLSVDESYHEHSNSGLFHQLQSSNYPLNLPLILNSCHSNSHTSCFSSTHSGDRRSLLETTVAKESLEKVNCYSSSIAKNDKELALVSRNASFSDGVENLVKDDIEVPKKALPDNSLFSSRRRASDGVHISRSNSLTPTLSHKMLHLAHQVPTRIVRKTTDIFFTPSNNLIQLMLGIASRIVSGEWRGVLSNFGEPIHWDFEDDSDDNEWLNSDYRNSNRVRMTDVKVSGSWEFD